MDSKFTKATPPNFTAPDWQRWVHASTTDATSRAAKRSRLGWRNEAAIEAHLKRLGWSPLYHDVKIMRVQVDLLMLSRERILTLLEVKTQTAAGLARMTGSQRLRLLRVAAFLSQWQPVELKLVTIGGGRIRLFEVE